MSGGSGDSGPGLIRTPGQYVTKVETGASESSLVAQQAFIMGRAIFLCQVALLAIIAVLTTILGWLIALVFIIAIVGVLCGFWIYRSREFGLPIVVFVLVAAACALSWSHVVDFLLMRPLHTTGLILVLTMTYFSIAIWAPSAFLTWRMAAEISDPSYASPRVSVKRVTPAWPWTHEDEFDEFQGDIGPSPVEREEMMVLLREALERDTPRSHALVVVRDHQSRPVQSYVPGYEELPQIVAPDDEEPVTILVEDAKGNTVAHIEHQALVPVDDLRRYLANHRLGLSYRKSKGFIGWGETSWRSAVRTLTTLGILSMDGDRNEPKMVVNIRTALDIVDSKLKLPEKEHKPVPTMDTSGQVDVKEE